MTRGQVPAQLVHRQQLVYQARDTAETVQLPANKATRSATRRLAWAVCLRPGGDQVTTDDGERPVEEANLVAASVLVGQDLIQRDRAEAGPVGLVDRVEAETADADIANAQVFFVLPAVVAEAKLQPTFASGCSAQQRVGRQVLDTPPAEEVVVIRIGSERPRATRESADQRGQQIKICVRIKEVAGSGRFRPDVFHPLLNLFADVIAVHWVQWGLFRTRTARLACGAPAYRLLLPPVRPTEPQASRNAGCRDSQIVARRSVVQPPDFQHPQQRLRGHTTATRWTGPSRLDTVVQISTSEYKIRPLKQAARQLLGYPHPRRVPRGVYAEQAIGISTDEVMRAKDSDVGYLRNIFPLLELGWDRARCIEYLAQRGFGQTVKSACVGCPFHGNAGWRWIRDHDPDGWVQAVEFDRAIRHGYPHATDHGQPLRGQYFLHRSCRPLDEVDLEPRTALRRHLHLVAADAAEEADPDGCSPWTCRSGAAIGEAAA